MKKFIFLLCLIFLVGCSDDVSVYSTYEQKEKVVKEEEIVTPEMTIFGINDSAKGYVIDVEKNKKWIVTVASSVVGHSKVLVETSTGQVVEGEIVAIDQENNIAIIFTKLSADIKPFHLAKEINYEISIEDGTISEAIIQEENELQGIMTVNKINEQYTTIFASSGVIQQLLIVGKDEPIQFEERLESNAYFANFPKVNYRSENIILTYDKDTFTYNPDDLYHFIKDFQKSLNNFFEKGDISSLQKIIASDDLLNTIQSIEENHIGMKQFGELEFTSSFVNDFQYVAEAKTTLHTEDEVGELKGTFKCILMKGEWKLISVYYQ